MTQAIFDVMQCGLMNVSDVSDELVVFFMIWVVKEIIQPMKMEAQAPKKVGNYLSSYSYKVLFVITSSVSSSFEIKSFSNCAISTSLTFVYLQY